MSSSSPDVEAKNLKPEYLPGFAEFSHFIASDDVFTIYRRFETLSARNILYLQSELQSLECQLQKLDEEDAALINSGATGAEKDHVEEAARVWESFSAQVDAGVERQVAKMKVLRRVREVMKEYEETLLRRSHILSLPQPSSQSLTAFWNFFRTKKPFFGPSCALFSSSAPSSSVLTVNPNPDPDRLTTLIEHYFGYYLSIPNPDRPPSWEKLYYFPAKRIANIVAFLSISIAAILLMGAILTLYFIPSSQMGRRVAAIGAFTTAFAVAVGLLTNAKRGEIFGITAAYAAVLVVFLSAPSP
ncbi:chorismate mutase protein [Rutstroemia sp. NJR-2017a BVV2]|nr:chorismate mutase protein [Rutstroemia sp. NJR-2017a BVV2]